MARAATIAGGNHPRARHRVDPAGKQLTLPSARNRPGRRERWRAHAALALRAPAPKLLPLPRTAITENHPLAAELDDTPVSTSTTP